MNDVALTTPMFGWKELRAAAGEDNSALITDFTNLYEYSDIVTANPTNSTAVDLSSLFGKESGRFANDFGSVDIAFYAAKGAPINYTPLENDTFGFQLWGWRAGPGGPGILLCQSTSAASCLLGDSTLGFDPTTGVALTAGALWCDTLAITNYWIETIAVYDSAIDRTAWLHIPDLRGIRHLRCEICTALGVVADEAANIAAVITAV